MAGLLSLGAVALVSVAVWLLEPLAPVLSLGVLYLFAVLPVAAIWGLPFAVPVSIVSMLVFNWLFLPPTHTFRLADSSNWVALAVYLVTAISVSGLSARARRRASEAEQRRREALLAADVSALLLEGHELGPRLELVSSRVARLLHARHARIVLDAASSETADEVGFELVAGSRRVGRLFLDVNADPDPEVVYRVCASIASLLATAVDREELAQEARVSEARRHRQSLEAEALRRSDAAKTAVLRSVSHDLRSPITAIMTSSEMLVSGDALGAEERDELVESVISQARRLDRLVADLLALSRLEAGAAAPGREVWTIDGLVARALELVDSADRVLIDMPADAPSVEVDPTQLERALANLLDNALKFSPSDAPVVVTVASTEGAVLLSVVDSGPGIPAHERERIFEPFVRGTTARGDRGSGLGLAIARGFVNLNGGRLWVDSGPDRGATFVISLPTVSLPAEVHA